MALPAEVQIGRISRFISKWLGTKGFSPRLTFGSEIVPMIPLWSGVENRFLDSWNLFGFNINLNASVGNINQYRFRNPSGSKMIAVFQAISFSDTAAAVDAPQLEIGPATTDFGTIVAVPTARLDPRGQPNPAVIVSTAQTAAITHLNGVVKQIVIPAASAYGEFFHPLNEIPLLPGDALQVNSNNANAQNSVAVYFRQRGLEDSELS